LFKLYKGSTLLDNSIQLVNLKGKNNRAYNKDILENILKDFRKSSGNIVYLLDNDAKFDNRAKELTKGKVYFVGKQDIEDSIASEVWIKLILKYFEAMNLNIQVTIDELEDIKNKLPEERIDRNHKFFNRVLTLLKDKLYKLNGERYNLLPDKGEELGNDLIPMIDSLDLINGQIKEAFDALE